jgi:hypothetical protein
LPGLACIYNLHWDDVQHMPFSDIEEHIDQMPRWARLIAGAAPDDD